MKAEWRNPIQKTVSAISLGFLTFDWGLPVLLKSH